MAKYYVFVNDVGEYLSDYDLVSGAKYYTDDVLNALAYENKFHAETLAKLLNCTVKTV